MLDINPDLSEPQGELGNELSESPSIIPSQNSIPVFRSNLQITPIITQDRQIQRLLERLLSTGGLSVNEAARLMGTNPNSIRQYLRGRRNKPSLRWFVALAELCGARVSIEFKQ